MNVSNSTSRNWPQRFVAAFLLAPATLPLAPAALFLTLAALPLVAQSADATPAANPARPTVTNPATLIPVGYLQFENGYLGSLTSPSTSAEYGINQVTKLAVHERLMFQIQTQPYAASKALGDTRYTNGSGDVLLGAQVLLTPPTDKKSPIPSVAIGYLNRVHTGTTGDVDLGSYSKSLVLLFSGDFKGFHYDTNYQLNQQNGTGYSYIPEPVFSGPVPIPHTVRRAQFAQTLSVNHAIFNPNLQLGVEFYHFTQPLVNNDDYGRAGRTANLFDILVAPSYQVRHNLIIDFGFTHGFSSTSTRWQSIAGFTYLLPHRLWPDHRAKPKS